MAIITVVGAGMMGSALCVPLLDRGHEVRLVGTPLDGAIMEALSRGQPHPTLRLELPRGLRFFTHEELGHALEGAEAVALGVSSAGVGWAASTLGAVMPAPLPILMVTKGLAYIDHRLRLLPDVLDQQLEAQLGTRLAPVAIAGPCIAGELARREQTCVVVAGRSAERAAALAELVGTDYYHVSVSTDCVGIEVCAALKNAFAMGMALPEGQHLARGGEPGSVALHNMEAAVFSQAIYEMQQLIDALGGDPRTGSGLAGVGDLDVTCNGGRTGRFGRLLGQGLGPAEAIARMEGATLECLEVLDVLRHALPAMTARGELGQGQLPLLDHLAAVALDGAAVELPLSRFFGRGSVG